MKYKTLASISKLLEDAAEERSYWLKTAQESYNSADKKSVERLEKLEEMWEQVCDAKRDFDEHNFI